MKKVGIICEYNPFHNGHIYHLQKIKEKYPDCLIVLVMSASFTMRGEISLLNKWDKTRLALNFGVDLVIELPTFYSTNSADTFSEGSLRLLSMMKVDYLVFGSENDDVTLLQKLASIQLENNDYDNIVKKYLDEGYNYPTSMSKALKDLSDEDLHESNDLLGLSYVKEIIKNHYSIIPVTIKRTNNYLDESIDNEISSATSIRKAIKENIDIKKVVPTETLKYLITDDIEKNYFYLLKYKILSDMDNLDFYLDVDEGLDNLIRKNILKATSLDDLIERIKTKRYTYNRLNRMFLHILLNVKKEDKERRKAINYIRVLGFNLNGKKYLKNIKKELNIPIITNYSDLDDDNLNFELYSTYIYHQIVNHQEWDLEEIKSIPIQKED